MPKTTPVLGENGDMYMDWQDGVRFPRAQGVPVSFETWES
jgi:hypothetical protein